jgi:hypothetical protein
MGGEGRDPAHGVSAGTEQGENESVAGGSRLKACVDLPSARGAGQ